MIQSSCTKDEGHVRQNGGRQWCLFKQFLSTLSVGLASGAALAITRAENRVNSAVEVEVPAGGGGGGSLNDKNGREPGMGWGKGDVHRLSNTMFGSGCSRASCDGIGVPKRHLTLWMQSRNVVLKKENAP